MAWLIGQRWLWRPLNHGPEFAADGFGARHGVPRTAALAARLERRDEVEPHPFELWLFPTHPSWEQRAEAVELLGD